MSFKFPAVLLFAISAAFAAPVQAAPLSFKTQAFNAQSCAGKNKDGKPVCHESTVAYPVTGDKHLDNWVRKQFHGKLPTQKSVQAALNRDEEVKATNQENRQRRKDGEYLCALDYVNTLELEGYTPNYAVFGEEDWSYLCGAHGNGTHSLTVLKRSIANPKPLELDDILLPDLKAKLAHLLKEAYVKYLIENNEDSEKDAREYADKFYKEGFHVTDNWRFGKNGLVFLYQIYEIGSYVDGRPELVIPVKDLQSIVKPEILREAAKYRTNPKIKD